MKTLFSLLFCVLSMTAFSQKIAFGNNPSAGKFYEVNGIKLYTEVYGKGKPLVLLHGNGGSIASMSSIIPFFSKKYQVIAIDSRAQGKSVDHSDSLSFEMMSDDVASLLDQMHIPKADYIGWSDGGIIALLMAIRHPEKVNKLAATGANIYPGAPAFPTEVWKFDKQYHDSMQYIPKHTAAEKNTWKLFQLDYTQPNIGLDELNKIKAPSLIVCGDHDLIRLEHTITIFQHIPDAQLWVVPHSGHATLIEHPKEFCATVDNFLK